MVKVMAKAMARVIMVINLAIMMTLMTVMMIKTLMITATVQETRRVKAIMVQTKIAMMMMMIAIIAIVLLANRKTATSFQIQSSLSSHQLAMTLITTMTMTTAGSLITLINNAQVIKTMTAQMIKMIAIATLVSQQRLLREETV